MRGKSHFVLNLAADRQPMGVKGFTRLQAALVKRDVTLIYREFRSCVKVEVAILGSLS